MKRRLVTCPNCEQNGQLNVLGELKKDGSFAILRFHRGETVINGSSFTVICGKCRRPIYIRNCARTNWHYYYQEWHERGTTEVRNY